MDDHEEHEGCTCPLHISTDATKLAHSHFMKLLWKVEKRRDATAFGPEYVAALGGCTLQLLKQMGFDENDVFGLFQQGAEALREMREARKQQN